MSQHTSFTGCISARLTPATTRAACLALVFTLGAGCAEGNTGQSFGGTGGVGAIGGIGGVGGVAGLGGVGGGAGVGGVAGIGAIGGVGGAGGLGGTGGVSGIGGAGGIGGTGGQGGVAGGLGPLVRAPGFVDAAPPLGQPLPQAPVGQWTWVDVPEMKCRDGSSSGVYVRYSDTSENFFVYLEGGGVCLDDFFCGINPKNINQTLNAESIIGGVTGVLPTRQMPGNDGIFKDDARNPVKDWNAVYVPYCTGDIWGGNRANATFPPEYQGFGTAGHTTGMHQFLGFNTTSIVLGKVVATFPQADKALLCGSSAGGIGALLNAHRLADLFQREGRHTRGFVVSDSAVPFADQYLATCTQKIWRDLWNLNASFPTDCEECFAADGGNIAPSLARYFLRKFPDDSQVIGGLISSTDDEIIKMFYGRPLPGCTPTNYGVGTYQQALADFRDNIITRERFSTYYLPGTLHMHLWRARFYEQNGTNLTIADWLTQLLNNEAVHVGAM